MSGLGDTAVAAETLDDYPYTKAVLEGRERWALADQDCLEFLKLLPDNCIDACITDPPYGLSKDPDIAEVMRHWLAGDRYEHGSAGFMSKSWDSFVPGPEYWREVYRVLKPGAHILAFAGSRTFDLMSIAIRFAGFENRDTIACEMPVLRWISGSGFPHGIDVSKAIDKAAGAERPVVGPKIHGDGKPTHYVCEGAMQASAGKCQSGRTTHNPATAAVTDEAKKWEGFNTTLKPSWEPILVFRKPLTEGTVAENVLLHGTGALNIAGCRVATTDNLNGGAYSGEWRRDPAYTSTDSTPGARPLSRLNSGIGDFKQPTGRWPANVALVHAESCRCVGTKKVKGDPREGGEGERPAGFGNVGADKGSDKPNGRCYGDEDGTETVEAWECVPECPVRQLDAQSGVSKSTGGRIQAKGGIGAAGIYGAYADIHQKGDPGFGNTGGASRFFYCAKTSRRERELGLDNLPPQAPQGNIRNTIPTVKPLALMRWLVRLVGGQPGSIILDPFAGSGTTLAAALLEGFRAIGVEREPEYVAIASARIAYWEKQVGGAEVEMPQDEATP
jgi:site-specific DNA-methyltransferase (adenine-specific)